MPATGCWRRSTRSPMPVSSGRTTPKPSSSCTPTTASTTASPRTSTPLVSFTTRKSSRMLVLNCRPLTGHGMTSMTRRRRSPTGASRRGYTAVRRPSTVMAKERTTTPSSKLVDSSSRMTSQDLTIRRASRDCSVGRIGSRTVRWRPRRSSPTPNPLRCSRAEIGDVLVR